MRHGMRRSIELLALSLLLPLWPAGDADAQFNGALRGDYDVTLLRTCVFSPVPPGFDANFVSSSVSLIPDIVVTGTATFDGAGGGSSTAVSFTTSGGAAPTSSINRANQTCTIAYTVNADGSFTETLNCNLTFSHGGPPPQPGQTATLNNIVLSGQIAHDGTVLLIKDTTPDIETFTITSGTSSGFVNQRVCTTTGSATSRR